MYSLHHENTILYSKYVTNMLHTDQRKRFVYAEHASWKAVAWVRQFVPSTVSKAP